ncbi:RPEL repeat protein [Lophiostoma macrostomum CBS 122681]|uniref:RPEL repeat protein n=1 Tax=Lophiostoma macrostomum CBS 122681 TaxID=1314788 RepID=A0A6A6T229_9PLEO|nr:RPEL repeat protein [Lophiostoma macrostomum CBS 122681]
MTSETTPIVDETPISPIRQGAERRNSLEKHLQHRPEAQDLKNRHILLDTQTAPALQAKALELERQRATDNLKKGLQHRPDRETLIERNILPESTAAPALQGHQKELERHMRADSLEKNLQSRPAPETLIKKGILEEDPLKEE